MGKVILVKSKTYQKNFLYIYSYLKVDIVAPNRAGREGFIYKHLLDSFKYII